MSEPTPVVSVKPVVLPAPGRGADLQVRVSAPATGRDLRHVFYPDDPNWSAARAELTASPAPLGRIESK
jgi:hypothetical protein